MKCSIIALSAVAALVAAAPAPQVDGNNLGSCQNKRQGEACQYINEYGHSVSGTCETAYGSQSNPLNPTNAKGFRCNPPLEDGSVEVNSPTVSGSDS